MQVKKGHGKETMLLNMNYKTITKKYIKKLSVLKKLNRTELMNGFKYIKSSPSFENLRNLFLPECECL